MKVIGIVGSMRRKGNTAILVQESLLGAEELGAEVALLHLSDREIAFCDGCESCVQTGECSIADDMQPLYDQLLAADGIILGTPVYFWNVSAQLKTFMDRTYALQHQRKLRNKVGGIVVVAERAGCVAAFSALSAFFTLHRMIEGGGAIAYGRKQGAVRLDERGLREARAAGRAVVRAIQRSRPEESSDVGSLGAAGTK